MAKAKKQVPLAAVQELADKAPQLASIGGTSKAADSLPGEFDLAMDVNFLKTTKCHIAMPCYGGMLTESTFMSFIRFSNTARELGINWTLETLVNESLISRARNTLVAKFLHRKDASHLMFIDADIGWDSWHLLLLLSRNKDVIGGLYPMKSMPVQWVVNSFPGAETDTEGLQEVSKTGTGFMLIKKEVFHKLDEHPAVKPYKNDTGLNAMYDQYLRTYFDTAVKNDRYYSEDWNFCENYRDIGGKIYVDKRILLKHTGSYVYSMENQDKLMNSIGPMYLAHQVNTGKVKIVEELTPE